LHSGLIRLIASMILTAILCLYVTTNTKCLPGSVSDKSGAKAKTEH
jgi:archaellum component FlaG (FlaF/FlaG flagellin family)